MKGPEVYKNLSLLVKRVEEMPNALTEADNSRGKEEEEEGVGRGVMTTAGGLENKVHQQTIATCIYFLNPTR